jgi:hypothetical protein
LFEDALEAGVSQWAAGSGWTLATGPSFSAAHAWIGEDTNASLRPDAVFNLSQMGEIALRFQAAQQLASAGDIGYVEASTNGSDWDIVATFDADATWETYVVDLTAYAHKPELRIRFRLASAGGANNDSWAIFDVQLIGRAIWKNHLPLIRK